MGKVKGADPFCGDGVNEAVDSKRLLSLTVALASFVGWTTGLTSSRGDWMDAR